MNRDELAVRRSLLARVARRYQIVSTSVSIGDESIEITRPLSAEEAWEAGQAEQAAEWGPYWAHLWESGRVLAEELSRLELADRRVLDIGCGLGLVGAVAARQGARVMLADAASDALLFARLNAWPWRARTSLRQLDWSCAMLPQRFDLIVGADLIYDRRHWEGLERFCRTHLAPGGQWLSTEPSRTSARPFECWMRGLGWSTESVSRTQGNQAVRLLTCRRNMENPGPESAQGDISPFRLED